MSARDRENKCPTCLSAPGEDCTQPTDTGRKYVSWEHSSRVDARSVFDPVKHPAARTWSGDLVDVFGEQFGAERIVRDLQRNLDQIEVAAVVGWLRGRGYSVELVTDNKCDNPPKSIPEDQVDAISVIDKTLDNIEGLDADWTSPEVVELLKDLRDRIVRGYIQPTREQDGASCVCDSAGPCCEAWMQGYFCTRERGHSGPHVACGDNEQDHDITGALAARVVVDEGGRNDG